MSFLSSLTAPQRLTAGLCTVLAAAGGAFAWQTNFGRALNGSDIAMANRSAEYEGKVSPAFVLPPVDPQFKETIERPLFVPTRRQSPPGNAAPAQSMKKGQYKLAGTVMNAGSSTVFLVEQATNKTHRVALGAEISGIKIESITATRVVLKQGDETEELMLRTSTSPKPAPTPQVAAAPPGAPQPQGFPTGQQAFLQPGVAVGAAPGAPGGPPLPAGIPGIAGVPQTSGGFPMNSPVTGQPVGGNQQGGAQAQAVDPNSPAARRRRFQNLPQ